LDETLSKLPTEERYRIVPLGETDDFTSKTSSPSGTTKRILDEPFERRVTTVHSRGLEIE